MIYPALANDLPAADACVNESRIQLFGPELPVPSSPISEYLKTIERSPLRAISLASPQVFDSHQPLFSASMDSFFSIATIVPVDQPEVEVPTDYETSGGVSKQCTIA
ncbi:unnamed protein product [Somion occarium]|uniref:Uncharacterized protein n=1 Tax=Somion occarium TaxID=3059160 RepID=A0ABP1CPJ4_9APHY